MQHVQVGQQAMKGTAAEAVKIRNKLHSTATRFGSHHLFVTITPDDLVDPIAAAYAGFQPSTNIEGMSEDELRIKNRDDMANTIAANPVACAMAFRAQLKIFIEEIIGWDLTDGISHPRVMANVLAFNAQVEEQGGQNLHAHILVTVAGLPHTHEALEQKLREHPQMTLRSIIKFVEAVKCNEAFSDAACQNEFMACNEEACQKMGQNQFVSVAVPAHIKNTTKPLGFAFPEPNTVRCPYSQSDELNGSVVAGKKTNAKQAIKTEADRRKLKYGNATGKQQSSHIKKMENILAGIPDSIKEFWGQIKEHHLRKIMKESSTSSLDRLGGVKYITVSNTASTEEVSGDGAKYRRSVPQIVEVKDFLKGPDDENSFTKLPKLPYVGAILDCEYALDNKKKWTVPALLPGQFKQFLLAFENRTSSEDWVVACFCGFAQLTAFYNAAKEVCNGQDFS
ncbi:hypothetical protein CYMTET_37769 [Cymbomonas tetramitiformis]|uniref:Helitron helicase-like domain-containing protein n=1 Tax=Cymbomonas tetramitiformis TaxID=36881 RepID=A0AAE0CD99_9CHLO|nr:hypothetical protein CYMTET_37769 [Cymbomonas tetramitiformis]